MSDHCPDPEALVEGAIDRVLTQYRESPRLLGLARGLLRQPAEVAREVCEILDHFDIDTATNDQLTIIGGWLGWPRCHCAGRLKPVFGFACEPLHRVVLADADGTPLVDCEPPPPPPPLAIEALPISTATLNQPYQAFFLTGSGGEPPYTYGIASGVLPPGITLDSETGLVSGTPTVVGIYPAIVLRVIDSLGFVANLPAFQIGVYGDPGDFGALDFTDPDNSMFIGQVV